MSDNNKTELPLDGSASRLDRHRADLHQPKRKKGWRIALLVLSVLALVGIGLGTFYASKLKQSIDHSYSTTGLKSEKMSSQLIKDKKPISFFGVGNRYGNDGWFWRRS